MKQRFAIKGITEGPDDILGIWRVDSTDGISFDTSGAKEKRVIAWTVDLPEDSGDAADILHQKKKSLAAHSCAIRDAGKNLEDTTHHGEMSQADATLQYNLACLLCKQPDISFGLQDWIPAPWRQTVADFKAFTRQMIDLLKPVLEIRTGIEEMPLAVSKVDLTGDFQTTWFQRADKTRTDLHMQTLSLSLESRLALIQLLAQTSAGAVVLAAKFSLPGGAVLALPAAWRYIRDIVHQNKWETIRNLKKWHHTV